VSAPPFERWLGNLRQKPVLLGGLLVLATLLLYGRVMQHEFVVFDDDVYVTANIHVNTGLHLDNILWAFTSFDAANWHPITWISHMSDCQVFGLSAGPHHLVNVALHAANVLLLFWLLQTATGAVWRSFFAAALFAVHPLNVETVAWVAQRKSLLSVLFSLVTIAAYGRYVRRTYWKEYLVVVVAFSLALMAKPMAVSLPLVLLLLDYWPLERYQDLPFRRKWVRLSIEKLPLFLMSAAGCMLTVAAQRSGGAVVETTQLPLSARFGNAIVSYAAYIGKAVWPARLSVFYPPPEHSLPVSDVIAATVVLLAITMTVLHLQRARYLVMGWFFFLITLIPVIGIVQVGRQVMADRYAYVPCIGLFVMIAWGLSDIVDALAVPRVIPAAAALCMVFAFAAATSRYLPYWQSGVKLFTHAIVVAGRPEFDLEEDLGDALASAGRIDEAFQHYGEACILLPSYALCHYNMAVILLGRNQLQDALEQYRLAVSFTDSKDMALSSLIKSGEILLKLGDYDTAEMRLAAALQIDPNNNQALQLRQQVVNQRVVDQKNSQNR
jgi:hypothetical protein